MNRVEELIQQLCPNGVEWKKLEKVCDYEQPTKYIVKSTNYNPQFQTPVLTAGQSFVLGYTDEAYGIYKASTQHPVIIFDDFTTSFQWVDFDFKVKSSAIKILTPSCKSVLLRFVYYLMQTIRFEAVEHTRYWISRYSQIEIPVPPLSIQQEIVRILDTFTELTANLQTELDARKKQYAYYRDWLLSFEGVDGVEWKKMGEIGTFIRGKRFVRTDIVGSGIPCIHYGDVYTFYGLSAIQTKGMLRSDLAAKMRYARKNDVVIVAAGENKDDIGIGVAWLGKEDAAVHDACFIFRSDMDPNFVSYYLRTNNYHLQIKKYVSEGKICSISADGLENIMIPIPPLPEQHRIVAILDNFETLVNDQIVGLPAELKARRKQYEYYRDKLLTFDRV